MSSDARKRRLWRKQSGRCALCNRHMRHWTERNSKGGLYANTATIDHIEPLSLGGSLKRVENQQLACSKCNNKRGNAPLSAKQAAAKAAERRP